MAERKKRAVRIAKGVKVAPRKKAKMEKKPGGSNVGKYKNVKKGQFCGPSGGSPAGSYPVNTKKRAKSALKLAHNAPNPEGIKKCVKRHYPGMGKSKKTKK